jgi:hypothetical protein
MKATEHKNKRKSLYIYEPKSERILADSRWSHVHVYIFIVSQQPAKNVSVPIFQHIFKCIA